MQEYIVKVTQLKEAWDWYLFAWYISLHTACRCRRLICFVAIIFLCVSTIRGAKEDNAS
jgi:hypothetical protein